MKFGTARNSKACEEYVTGYSVGKSTVNGTHVLEFAILYAGISTVM